MIVTGPREWRGAVSGGGQGKALHQRVVGVEQADQGSGHGIKQPEFREHLDEILFLVGFAFLSGSVWNQQLVIKSSE